MTIFVTLTFDDAHLKTFHYTPELSWDTKAFDNLQFRKMIRHLRQVDLYSFKYVSFPEYGHEDYYKDYKGRIRKGTKRPHYHVLFFFDYTHDISVFRRCVLNAWGNCQDCALDVVQVTSDDGFTRYVSKYVSKGLNDELPFDLVERVKRYRAEIQNINNVPRETIDHHKYIYQHMAHFLHWYDERKPKLLCSKGVGTKDWTEKELLDGTTTLFNGKVFESVPLSSYTKRKTYFDRSKRETPTYYKLRDGNLDIYDERHYKPNYDWSLNDFGRSALIHQLPKRIQNTKLWFEKAFALSGVIPPDAVDLYNQSHKQCPMVFGTRYEDIIGNYDLVCTLDDLVAWKLFYSRYDLERLSDLLGFDYRTAIIDYTSVWQDFYTCLVNSNSVIDNYGSNYKKDLFTLADFNMKWYNIKNVYDGILICVEITQYVSYLTRKREREEKKALKRTIYDRDKRY